MAGATWSSSVPRIVLSAKELPKLFTLELSTMEIKAIQVLHMCTLHVHVHFCAQKSDLQAHFVHYDRRQLDRHGMPNRHFLLLI